MKLKEQTENKKNNIASANLFSFMLFGTVVKAYPGMIFVNFTMTVKILAY